MITVSFDADHADRDRRERLYAGELFVNAPSDATLRLCALARELIAEAFPGQDPLHVQETMEVAAYAAILAPLKRGFIHDPRSIATIAEIVRVSGCDPETTYIDVPRLRIATHSGYLTSGVAYAHHPHRDTWYSAPPSQINWWVPIFDFDAASGMAFHPAYWDRAIANSSNEFDYYEWNANGRKNAAQHVTSDTRRQPTAQESLDALEPQLRLVTRVGSPLLFSAAHLHSTAPNASGRTRWSFDFRTVDIGDVAAGHGARTADSRCTGTSLRDFVRARDFSRMPEELAARYDGGRAAAGPLVFAG